MKKTGLQRTQWIKEVAAWGKSGQTARVFATGRGYRHETLMHWAWLLRYDGRNGRGAAAARARELKRRRGSDRNRAPQWIDVPATARADGDDLSTFQLTLGTRILSLPTSVGGDVLQRLVRAIEAA